MDMPEAHESAERGQMAQEGLAGASPADQTTFPSNVEDQVKPTALLCQIARPQTRSTILGVEWHGAPEKGCRQPCKSLYHRTDSISSSAG